MDVTNPGLVNVADQSVGRPDTSVPALSVPYESDAVVAAADAAQPAALLATVRVFPTPAVHDAGDAQLPAASQDFGQVPGVAPRYAPFPPASNPVSPDDQYVPQAGTSEFTVAGPRTSIQTNQNPESGHDYSVTSVLDADTGGVVTEPATSVSGTFSGVFDQTTKLRFASPSAFPDSLVDGVTMGITCPTQPSYQAAGQVSGVVNVGGLISAVSSADGGAAITVSSNTQALVGVTAGRAAALAFTGVASYNGTHEVSNVRNLNGSFDAVKDAGAGLLSVIFPSSSGLVVGDQVTLGGTYGGPHAVVALSDYDGAFQSVTDAGAGVITVHVASMPAGVNDGQFVTLAGAVYAGTYQISNVTANSFDCTPPGGFIAASWFGDAGTFASHTAVFIEPWTSSYADFWTCRTFDVAVAYVSSAAGTWRVSNFDLPGTYVDNAGGTWSYYPTNQLGTTRYRLGLAPADLDNFGVVIQEREIVFADPTLTAANSGASRIVEFATESWIVIGKYDEDSDVPVLTTPQVGDELTLFVQREGSELFVEHLGQVVNLDLLSVPPVTAASPVTPSFASQGSANSSTGAQPGQPVIGHGVQVPTAVTVQVAEQATVVGLPVNVFA